MCSPDHKPAAAKHLGWTRTKKLERFQPVPGNLTSVTEYAPRFLEELFSLIVGFIQDFNTESLTGNYCVAIICSKIAVKTVIRRGCCFCFSRSLRGQAILVVAGLLLLLLLLKPLFASGPRITSIGGGGG